MLCFVESHCNPALLKVAIYSTELEALIFVWKATPLFVGNCVNLHFTTVIAAIHLSVVNVLEEKL